MLSIGTVGNVFVLTGVLGIGLETEDVVTGVSVEQVSRTD